MKRANIEVNANFHLLSGQRPFRNKSAAFAEYRKKWAEWPKSFKAGAFPLFIDIETTSVCNLSCDFCATTYRGKKVKKGFIEPSLAKKIIDEGARKGLCGVKFNIRGEPLLHPDIVEFVRYAKVKGLIDVYFNTNAMPLTVKMAEDLIAAGLDRISISFEGYTKKVYERYRKGARYERVLGNIRALQKLKKSLRVRRPVVRIQTVMLPELKEDIERYKSFWSREADEVAFLDYKDMKEKKKGLAYPWACPQIWQRMAVWWDGTILPCNHDDDGLLDLGNIRDITIEEAWNSDRLNRIRQAHKNGSAHIINACDGCYLRDSEIKKLEEGGL